MHVPGLDPAVDYPLDVYVVRLRAPHAVAMCTGSRAALPPLPGIEKLRPWTSREATSAQQPPRCLVIVRSGAVGVEMATAWQALGSTRRALRGP